MNISQVKRSLGRKVLYNGTEYILQAVSSDEAQQVNFIIRLK